MPEQATQSTLEGNFKVIELLCYHSKCVPISRACREGTCLTPGLKTEHLVNKCIIIWPRERKAVLKFGVQHLANSFPACAPPWWHLVQHMDSFPNLTTRDNLHLGLYYKSIFRKGDAHMRFSTFCVFLQTFCKSCAVKHTYHPLSACHWKMAHPSTEWNDLKIGLLSN